MAEMILPGTYIEVRDEGLIVPGPIAIGNVGIVGTARRGRVNTVYTPANIGDARDILGQYDAFDNPEETRELTLVRALELAYANGAQRVFVVRVAASGATVASYTLAADTGNVTLNAVAPGSGYDGAQVTTGPYSLGLGVSVAGPGGTALETLGNLPQAPAELANQLNSASSLFSAANDGGNADVAIGATVNRTTDGVNATPAIFQLSAGTGQVELTARQAGTGMNSASADVADGTAAGVCNVTLDNGSGVVETWDDVPRAPATFISTLNGDNAGYDYGANASSTDPTANLAAGSELFTAADAASDADVGNQSAGAPSTNGAAAVAAIFSIPAGAGFVRLTAQLPGAAANSWTVSVNGFLDLSITLGPIVETFRAVPSDVASFVQVINGGHATYRYSTNSSTGRGSGLFSADAGGASGDVQASQTGSQATAGSNGAGANSTDYGNGLAALQNENVHIVTLAGQGLDMRDILVGHLENSSGDLMKRERIGVIGSSPSAARTDLTAPAQDEGRLVFVGPGVRVFDAAANREVTLPGTYAAAAIAGKISSLDPHASPTNKTVNVRGLETVFNGTVLEQLVLGRVLALESRNGSIRIVRGITTSTNTAWAQVTTRRIVDFARFGTRAAANPFIGKLNNERVRQALKGSINSFLADMVDREMLISYELDVSATRDQQIRGIAQVTMVLRPTFSIDYIRVVMYLE